MGIATVGSDGIVWGWQGKGVAQIFASWIIAPALAGAFAAIIFSVTKYGVLKRSNPLKWGMVMVPIYFAITSGILTMLIVWKGVSDLPYADTEFHRMLTIIVSCRLPPWIWTIGIRHKLLVPSSVSHSVSWPSLLYSSFHMSTGSWSRMTGP